MYVDFAIIDTDNEDKKVKETICSALKYNVNSITVPYYLLKSCKPILKNSNTDLSCLVDFPLGISDGKTRCYAVEQAISCGANSIDISMPQNLAANRKYEKIREDIRNIRTIYYFFRTHTHISQSILGVRWRDRRERRERRLGRTGGWPRTPQPTSSRTPASRIREVARTARPAARHREPPRRDREQGQHGD